jgi:alpha-beta hydrolase superfamily lysophospholipase
MLLLAMGGCGMNGANVTDEDLETSVCGKFREPLAFWQFRSAAGMADERRIRSIRDIERLSFATRDGRVLGGYKLRAAHPRGYLLVAQGNAMLADTIIGILAYFRDRDLDVHVYDYRGYGLSEGKSRLKAIVSDYRDIVASLNARGYARRYLYGMSMGGVILTNAVGVGGGYDALVIDSSPSRISGLGCPESYDPVRHIPPDASRLMVIMGSRDRVIPPPAIEELAHAVRDRGGRVLQSPDFSHPLQDYDPAIRQRRFREVAEFLLR